MCKSVKFSVMIWQGLMHKRGVKEGLKDVVFSFNVHCLVECIFKGLNHFSSAMVNADKLATIGCFTWPSGSINQLYTVLSRQRVIGFHVFSWIIN